MTTVEQLEAQIRRQGEQLAAMSAPRTISEGNEVSRAWHRWDSLYQALGDQTPAAYPGEKPRAYLRRLADGVRKYTISFQNYAFHDSQQAIDLALVSDQIFAEALAHSKKPVVSGSPAGYMREIVTHPNGKTRVEFVGDHRAPWLPFQHPRKFYVVRFKQPEQ